MLAKLHLMQGVEYTPLNAGVVLLMLPFDRANSDAKGDTAAGGSGGGSVAAGDVGDAELVVRRLGLLSQLEAAGLWEVGAALVVPLATGMAITATLLALRCTVPPTARCAEG